MRTINAWQAVVLSLLVVVVITASVFADWDPASFYKGAFKKTAGVAHTSNAADPPNEGIPSQVSIALNQVMGQAIPGTPPDCDPQDSDDLGIVEYWEVDLVLLSGTDSKAYEAVFPDDYDGHFGTGVQGDSIRDWTFCVPLSYNTTYAQSDHNGGFGPDLYDDAVRISSTAASDWWFDPYAAIVTSETNLGLGSTGTLRVYLWTGSLLSDNVKLNNFEASTDPTTGDDEDDGYDYGSMWINASTEEVFACVLPTAANAVWISLVSVTPPTASEIADAVWDELRSGHVDAGSFGQGVLVEDFNSTADDAIEDAVWDGPTADHTGVGTFGKLLNDLTLEGNFEVAESRTLTDGDETLTYTATQSHNNTYHQIADEGVAATGTLTLAANAGNTETATIDAIVYTFQTSLTDGDCHVKIGAAATDTLDNLIAAITAGSGSGTLYSELCVEHTTVTAVAGTGDTMDITALDRDDSGNSIATTETLANGSFGGATLSGGVDDQVDLFYDFDIGVTNIPHSVFFHGRFQDNAGDDSVMAVYTYSWYSSSWIELTDDIGVSDIDKNIDLALSGEHVGDYGGAFGHVYIRFLSGDADLTDELYLDFLTVTFSHAGTTSLTASQIADSTWVNVDRSLDNPVDLTVDAVDDVWDEGVAAHQTVSTFGRYVYDVYNDTDAIQDKLPSGDLSDFDESTDPVELLNVGGSAGTSAAELVDDAWDEAASEHVGAGSFGLHVGGLNTDDVSSIKTAVESTEGVVTHVDYGNAKLVRSATPVNTLVVDSSGYTASNIQEIFDSGVAAEDWKKALTGIAGCELRLDYLDIQSPSATAVNIEGAGLGHGVSITSGAGIGAVGFFVESIASASGAAAKFYGASVATGMSISGSKGLHVSGTLGSSPGLHIEGAVTGTGLLVEGGATSGDAIHCSVTSGDEIDADLVGSVASVVADVTTDTASRTASKADVSNLDAAVSTRSSHSAADVTGGTTVAGAESNIRGGSDTLDSLSDQIDVIPVNNSATAVADAVWDELVLQHQNTGSTGYVLWTSAGNLDAALTDTNEIQGKLPTGDLVDAAAVNTECDTALVDYDGPTDAEMDARTLLAANYFDPAADTVANVTTVASVTLVDTCTTNTDMLTASAAADGVWDELTSEHTGVGSTGIMLTNIHTNSVDILADTNEVQGKLPSGDLVDSTDVQTAATASLNVYDPPTKAEMDTAHALLSTHSAANVWSVGTRGLTEAVAVDVNNDKTGYSIAGAKNTLDDLNDLSAAQVNAQVDLAIETYNLDDVDGYLTDLTEDDSGVWRFTANALEQAPAGDCASQASVDDLPTNAELAARTLVAAGYFVPSADIVAHVTLCDTVTTNTNERGTDSASTHTAANVWTVVTRGLTEVVVTDTASRTASKADVSGLLTWQQFWDYDASQHNAAAVWAVGTRTITGGTVGTCTTNTDMLTSGAVADQVWDEIAFEHTEAGSLGALVDDIFIEVTNIVTDTNEIQGKLPAGDLLDSTSVQSAVVTALGTYDPPTKAELDLAVAGLSTHAAADVITALLAQEIDGLSYENTMEAMRAIMFGKTSRDGLTFQFYAADGVTPKVQVVYNTNGIRSSITVYD